MVESLFRAGWLEVAVVDPVTLIQAALAAGAVAGVGESATAAVKDAYTGLRGLVARRLAGKPSAEVALAEHEQDPDTWGTRWADWSRAIVWCFLQREPLAWSR